MPQSKNRPGHHTHHPHAGASPQGHKKKGSPVIVSVIFLALLGAGISYLLSPGNSVGLLIGSIAGAVAGFFFGRQIEQTISKK